MPATLHPDASSELQLLHHALDRDDTPEAIATELGLTPADLLDIVDTPPARAAHEASLRFIQQRNRYRTALAIGVAISKLSDTLRESKDPTQTLRACAILARLIAPRAPARSAEPRLSIAPPSTAAPHTDAPPRAIDPAPQPPAPAPSAALHPPTQPPCLNRTATVRERLSPHPQTSHRNPNPTTFPTPHPAPDAFAPSDEPAPRASHIDPAETVITPALAPLPSTPDTG